MTEQALEKRREYQRNYRRQNPDKVKQWAANYWEKKAREAETNND